jgi:hypothetical protein
MPKQIFVLRVDTMTDKHVAFTPEVPGEHQESYTSLAEAVGLLVLAQHEVLGLEVIEIKHQEYSVPQRGLIVP